MSSWTLLRNALLGWFVILDNPIYWHEIDHHISRGNLARWLSYLQNLSLPLAGLSCFVFGMAGVYYPFMLLLTLLVILIAWYGIICLLFAPIVAEERYQQTWELLIATALPIETILLGKIQSICSQLRFSIIALGVVLLLAALALGLVYRDIMPFYANPVTQCGMSLVTMSVIGGLFLADRWQHYVGMVVMAVASSAGALSSRQAALNALVGVFGMWLVEILGTLLVIILWLPAEKIGQTLLVITALGPAAAYLDTMPILPALLLIVLTLLLREAVVRSLWARANRMARQL
ncbi:MAG TPA: hypothetical protein VHP83_20635 [Aggregatilineaceae bacterium]|nr:hypothetical protein [Aggregatilineaceae bacterium]